VDLVGALLPGRAAAVSVRVHGHTLRDTSAYGWPEGVGETHGVQCVDFADGGWVVAPGAAR